MGHNTSIEWCDHTFNPWEGCTKVGPGCDHCYAETRNARFGGGTSPNWGTGAPRRRTTAANWRKPLKWDADAALAQRAWEAGVAIAGNDEEALRAHGFAFIKPRRPRVFCASLADWLDNEVPIEWLVDLLDLIRRTPNLDCLLLTKRIGNWHKRITAAHQHVVRAMGGGDAEQNAHPLWELGLWLQDWLAGKAPANVWIGATVVNQTEANRDLLWLMEIAAAVRFVSIEPMLGPIELTRIVYPALRQKHEYDPYVAYDVLRGHMIGPDDIGLEQLDWVICGGESGNGARPMHPDWARSLRDQCAAAGVPFLFKQWGEWAPGECGGAPKRTMDNATLMDDRDDVRWQFDRQTVAQSLDAIDDETADVYRYGKKAAGRSLDGIEHNGFPEPC